MTKALELQWASVVGPDHKTVDLWVGLKEPPSIHRASSEELHAGSQKVFAHSLSCCWFGSKHGIFGETNVHSEITLFALLLECLSTVEILFSESFSNNFADSFTLTLGIPVIPSLKTSHWFCFCKKKLTSQHYATLKKTMVLHMSKCVL